MTVGRTIAAARHRASLTQFSLALAVGVSPSTVAYWEADRAVPRVETRRRVERTLGLKHRALDPENANGGDS